MNFNKLIVLVVALVWAVVGHGAASAASMYFVQTDQLNTPRAITDENNVLVWKWDSDPYGAAPPNESPAGAPAFAFGLRFPGQVFDKESYLYYNYHRDYDPQTGRYVQSDPIGLAGGINTYAYVGANPISGSDPLGLARQLDPKGQECTALRDKIARKKQDINKRIQECKANPQNLPYYPPYAGAPPRMSVQGHEGLIQDLKDTTADDEALYAQKCGGGSGGAPALNAVPQQSTPTTAQNAEKAAAAAGGLGVTYWIISEGLRVVFPPRNLVPIP